MRDISPKSLKGHIHNMSRLFYLFCLFVFEVFLITWCRSLLYYVIICIVYILPKSSLTPNLFKVFVFLAKINVLCTNTKEKNNHHKLQVKQDNMYALS